MLHCTSSHPCKVCLVLALPSLEISVCVLQSILIMFLDFQGAICDRAPERVSRTDGGRAAEPACGRIQQVQCSIAVLIWIDQ